MTISLHDAMYVAGVLITFGGYAFYVRSAVKHMDALTEKVHELHTRVSVLETKRKR